MKSLRELSLDELNNIAGGRLVTETEWYSYSEALRKLTSICRKLGKQEATALRDTFDAQAEQWYKDIKNAPEGSADILFDTYMADKWA